MKELGLSSHHRLKHSVLEENLSKKELESLKNLSKNPHIIIQKSDKGVAILNKEVYILLENEVDGVAMDSPLGPTLANISLCHYRQINATNANLAITNVM